MQDVLSNERTGFLQKCVGLFLMLLALDQISSIVHAQQIEQESKFEYGLGEIRMDPDEYSRLLRTFPITKQRLDYFDWRDSGGVTPAKNQGACGSCFAFAITGIFESWIKILYGRTYDLSEQFFLSCATNHSECCGGNFGTISFFEDHDPVLETCLPYGDSYTSCESFDECPCTNVPCSWSCAPIGSRVDHYFTVSVNDIDQMIQTLHDWGPAYFSFEVHTDFKTYWNSPSGTSPWSDGVYVNYQTHVEGGHAVLLIGYDSVNEYWICKNSWGTNGGPFHDGTFKIAWEGHENNILWGCGHADMTGQPFTPVPTSTPTRTPAPPTATPSPTAAPGDNCSNPIILNVDDCYCGTTFQTARNDHDCGIGHSGPDLVFRFDGFQPGRTYRLIGEAETNADWTIASTCGESVWDVLCEDYTSEHQKPSCSTLNGLISTGYILFDWLSSRTQYYIWVDGYNTTSMGRFCLEVVEVSTPTPTPTRTPTRTPTPTSTPTRTPTRTPTPTPIPRVLWVPLQYTTIQAAIDDANSGDTVLVADGIYTGAANKNLNFGGKSIKVISQNGPTETIIDCQSSGRGVYFSHREGIHAVFQGFTIRNGRMTTGGAIAFSDASATIANCIFSDNLATDSGGAIACSGSSPYIINCLFESNQATNDGGGLFIAGGSEPQLLNCTFSMNQCNGNGGGIHVHDNETIVRNCIFWGDRPNEIYLDFWGQGSCTASYSDIERPIGVYPGIGNINTDPLFITGPLGDYYLSFRPNSPCIDAGGDLAEEVCFPDLSSQICLDQLMTTASLDDSIVDMGFHYPDNLAPTSTPIPTYTPGNSPTPTQPPYQTPTPTETPTPTPTMTPTIETSPTSTPTPTIRPPRILYVPSEFTTIRAAIDYSIPGDTILVADGTYSGSENTMLDFDGKAITLASENGPDACYIDCSNFDSVFRCVSRERDDTIIQGFTIGYSERVAVQLYNASPMIADCMIMRNHHAVVCESNASPVFLNCLIAENQGTESGTAVICMDESFPSFYNCTIAQNRSSYGSGGIFCDSLSSFSMINSIIWHNDGRPFEANGDFPRINYSNIESEEVVPGTNNLNLDPLFTGGPLGEFYLYDFGVIASPCIDYGDTNSSEYCLPYPPDRVCMNDLTTSRYGWIDSRWIDLGFHYQSIIMPTPTSPPPTATPTPVQECIHNGDVNGDDQITAEDAQVAFYIAMSLYTPTFEEQCSADCNNDSSVTAGDAQSIFYSVFGMGSCTDPLK